MRKFRKTAAVVAAAALALSLCACGGKTDKATTEQTSGGSATVTDATASTIEDDGDWTTTEQEVVEDDRFTTVEGADAIGVTFDDGTDGFTSYINNGNFTMSAENGELVCDITKSGPLEHSCQIYYDGFTMAKGCVYTMSFDVRSDIERVIQWRVQINGGDYHAYASDFITVGPETQTITKEFTMEENSDPAPRFVVNMGTQEGQTEVTEALHTCMNHSATHLLQKALKTVLGGHVEQAGSYVDQDRLRFDFTHNQALSKEEIEQVEAIVNEKIAEDLPVVTKVMSLEEAKKTGAMALFGEKYGETVRVVNMGDFSIELCGGTHVEKTGVIATFKIVSEAGVAAGVRRIEALTSRGAFAYYHNLENTLKQASAAAKAEPANLVEKIEGMLAEIKQLQSENQKLKDKMAKAAVGDVLSDVVSVGDYKVLPVSVSGVDMNALRNLGDEMKTKIASGVVILASDMGDKVNLIVMATDDAVKAGAHAGNIIKKIAPMVGGGGGGRPNMAQAGGKNPAGIKDALEAGVKEAEAQLS